jgi:ABC-type sugar transport system ATPase subunit
VSKVSSSLEPVLSIESASKRFGAVVALDDVSLSLAHGEILAVLGDNGAGKSTLIKCVSGVHQLDAGRLLIDSAPVSIRSPSEARALGIETVYQDLALFDNLSPSANFYAGRERSRPRWMRNAGFLRDRLMTKETQETLDRLRVSIPASASTMGLMSGGQRQAVAVARAVAFASRVVILDEPTAALGVRESQSVLDLVKRLPDSGTSVILISHNLEHVAQVADRAVVLRRGRLVGEALPTAANHQLLVSLIVGGEFSNAHRQNTDIDEGSRSATNKVR